MPKNLNQILQQISAIIPNYCDKCGSRYDRDDLEIVNQEMGTVTCRLDCKKCGNSYVMHISNPVDGMLAAKKANIKTDITADEMRKFSEVDKIDNEEILDVFIALKAVRNVNDLQDLLGNE
jgi:malate/lactate dehydrogenase